MNNSNKKKKIAIFCGNISTYHCPFFKLLSKDTDLTVMFGSQLGIKPQYNKEHNTTISYNSNMLLSGYKYIFLKNYFENNNRRGFFSRINLDIPFYIYKNKFDYVFIFGYDTFSSWLCLFSSIILRKKIIWRGEVIKGRKTSIPKKIIKYILLNLFFINCDYILYTCKKNYEFLTSYNSPKKLFSFPCSVDNDSFRKEYNFLKQKKKFT